MTTPMTTTRIRFDANKFDFSTITDSNLTVQEIDGNLHLSMISDQPLPVIVDLYGERIVPPTNPAPREMHLPSDWYVEKFHERKSAMLRLDSPLPLFEVFVRDDWRLDTVFEFLGILDRPYKDDSGNLVTPLSTTPTPVEKLFVRLTDRVSDIEKNDIERFREVATRVVLASPEFAEALNLIDFVALHAFDCIDDWFLRSNGGEWLLDGIEGKSMRKFLMDYPLLAGIACSGSDLFDVAKGASSADEGCAKIIERITTHGFPEHPDIATVGPMSRDLLNRIKGLRYEISNLTFDRFLESSLDRSAKAFDFFRHLPPDAFPTTSEAFLNLSNWSAVISNIGMDDEYCDEDDIFESGLGMGISFTDDELASALADQCAARFSEPLPKKFSRLFSALGYLGAKLDGHENVARKYFWNFPDEDEYEDDGCEIEPIRLDFTALKAEIVAKGFLNVCREAQEFCDSIQEEGRPWQSPMR